MYDCFNCKFVKIIPARKNNADKANYFLMCGNNYCEFMDGVTNLDKHHNICKVAQIEGSCKHYAKI